MIINGLVFVTVSPPIKSDGQHHGFYSGGVMEVTSGELHTITSPVWGLGPGGFAPENVWNTTLKSVDFSAF